MAERSWPENEPAHASPASLGTAAAGPLGPAAEPSVFGVRPRHLHLVAGAALAFLLLGLLSAGTLFTWSPVPFWVPVVALAASVLLVRRVPAWVAAFWLLGLLSLAWSLAPGDTLLTSLWALSYVALAAAGRFRHAFLVVMVYLLLQALFSAWSLNHFGLVSYVSGSVHYLLGAKALVVLAPALTGFAVTRRTWLVVPLWTLATLAAYGALMSGSRGVYLPLAIVLVLACLRLVRRPGRRRRALAGIALMAVAIVAVDAALPSHPVATAFERKASLGAQQAAVQASGGFTQRLRFWDQGLGMAVARPLGVGAGGFRSTINAFQRFPMVWSSSPHDVFVETAATVGWPGLALLVVLLATAFARAWRSDRWPWALALLGIWSTLAVDITADYPGMMAIAFGVVGACLGAVKPRDDATSPGARPGKVARSLTAGLVIATGVALTAWWFVPCSGTTCALSRWRGAETKVGAALPRVPASERSAYFHRLQGLYPKSLWVLRLEQAYASTPARRLALAREVATRYPLETWQNYLSWAQLSLAQHHPAQAREAVKRGLEVFGPHSRRYPGWRSDPSGFARWLQDAKAILAETASSDAGSVTLGRGSAKTGGDPSP